MIIKFLDKAQLEFDEAIDFYNNESDGLGSVFLQEVLNAIERSKLPGCMASAFQKHQEVPDKAFSIWSYLYKT